MALHSHSGRLCCGLTGGLWGSTSFPFRTTVLWSDGWTGVALHSHSGRLCCGLTGGLWGGTSFPFWTTVLWSDGWTVGLHFIPIQDDCVVVRRVDCGVALHSHSGRLWCGLMGGLWCGLMGELSGSTTFPLRTTVVWSDEWTVGWLCSTSLDTENQ